MSDEKQETRADIIAEMRRGLDKSWHEIDREWLHDIPDRLEAAWKREREATTEKTSAVGNAAAMREALATVIKIAAEMRGEYEIADSILKDGWATQLESIAKAALSIPARNCDLYATATEALKAQDVAFNEDNFKNGECRLGCPGCDDGLIDCKILWLFAPAAERKGDGDGR